MQVVRHAEVDNVDRVVPAERVGRRMDPRDAMRVGERAGAVLVLARDRNQLDVYAGDAAPRVGVQAR